MKMFTLMMYMSMIWYCQNWNLKDIIILIPLAIPKPKGFFSETHFWGFTYSKEFKNDSWTNPENSGSQNLNQEIRIKNIKNRNDEYTK